MKSLHILSAVALLSAPALAQDEQVGSRNIAMRPTEKRSLALNTTERNPYAKRSLLEEEVQETENTEEVALRQKISSLTVSGASRTHRSATLLLGDIVVRQGMILPPILPNQTQFLQVVEISEKRMVLEWLNPDSGELTGKKIQVPYDLTPSVVYVLQGQSEGSQEVGIFKPRR